MVTPDGRNVVFQATRRGITYLDAFMEDMHVWTIDAAGNNRRELGAAVDNRQGEPCWDPKGQFIYFTVQERGTANLCRIPVSGGSLETVIAGRGLVGSWSV